MDTPSHSDVVHLSVDERLPAVPVSVPAVEVLKQILEQMLENERRRVRNEFIRIGSLFLGLLLLILSGGFWIAHDILTQVKEARRMTEHSQEALMTLLSAASRKAPAPPESRSAGSAENPAEIQTTIADLEGKNKALSELIQTQNANLKNLLVDVLKTRDTEIQDLREKINAKQAQVITSGPRDADAAPAPSGAKPLEESRAAAVKVAIPDRPLVKTVVAPVALDLLLRLPIPSP